MSVRACVCVFSHVCMHACVHEERAREDDFKVIIVLMLKYFCSRMI